VSAAGCRNEFEPIEPQKKMAEINIVRKKKPVWPYLLVLLIIALIAWALYNFTDEPNETEAEEAPATGLVIPAPPQPVAILEARV
jgi:hypothetical protein